MIADLRHMIAELRQLPATLFVGLVALSFVIVYSVVDLESGPFGPEFGRAISDGGHDVYWPVLLLATAVMVAAGLVAARSRREYASVTQQRFRTRLATAATLWAILATSSIIAYATVKNVEAVVLGGLVPGLAVLAPLASLPVATEALAALLAVAIVALVMSSPKRPYQAVLTSSYGQLVASGLFAANWEQPPWAVEFVSGVMRRFLEERGTAGAPPRVLECGCGTGVWLSAAAEVFRGSAASLSGFDLSPAMIDVARTRLASVSPVVELGVGDALDDAAYANGFEGLYDLIFAYDVVQQLPQDLQGSAVSAMLSHVEPGGWLVVFDNDIKSRFGRTMGLKKWLRRYLKVPLVPRFYIHARYPDVSAIRRRAERATSGSAEVLVAPGLKKRALIVRVPGPHEPTADP